MAQRLQGTCHCGAIEVDDATALSPRHCSCSFCQKHGSLYVSSPSARLTITLAEPERVSRYAFGHETATFLVCARCGVMAAAVSEIEGRLRSVLNANMLSPPLTSTGERSPSPTTRRRTCRGGWSAVGGAGSATSPSSSGGRCRRSPRGRIRGRTGIPRVPR